MTSLERADTGLAPGGPALLVSRGRALPTGGVAAAAAAALGAAAGMWWSTTSDPALSAELVAVVALVAVTYGLLSKGRLHRGPWRVAWAGLGSGLMWVLAGDVLQALRIGPPATQIGVAMAMDVGGALLAIAGVTSLIHDRLPERSADSLAEALLPTMALAFVILALIVVPSQGWMPGHQLPAMVAPMLDLVLICLVSSFVSLTDRHPDSYRYLIAAFVCLLAADTSRSALSLAGHAPSSTLAETVALLGALLWGLAFVHPSQKVRFDPVPLRSMRPSGLRVAMCVVVSFVAPVILSVQYSLGALGRQPALLIGSTFLPLLLVLYLLHQVYTRAAAEYRAQHDSLTGVCNRVLFEDQLQVSLAQAERTGASVAVMFLDLDRFKDINDSLGHAVGNDLLKAVVKRLQGCLRDHDTLARFGGDEFTFLIPECGGKDGQVVEIAERILERFDSPFNVGGRQLTVKGSIGIAVSPWDGADSVTLLKHADTAMYQAKAAGRNTYEIFDSAMSARAQLRFALEDSLRFAVEFDRLAVHYQPKFDMTNGEIAGVEALARWHHPRLGFIPPWAFIPLAEETSLVATVGEWVLEVACRQAQAWQAQGLPAVPVAVNLSPRQFAHQSVVTMVSDVLARTGLDPRLLELGVTESVLMEGLDEVAACLNELRAMGVRCSIDDFGTGYSALTYLAEMPIDAIKIDRSFVQRIDGDASGAPIVGAVIALAHSLNLVVVAEGVETEAQVRFLDAHGCDQVQGFRFSPPIPAEQCEELMRTPVQVFTRGRSDHELEVLPDSGIAPARLEALLESIMSDRRWPADLDDEAIGVVLAALQIEELQPFRRARPVRPRSAKVAVSTLAGLSSVSAGAAATGAMLGTSGDVAVEAEHGAAPGPTTDPAVSAPLSEVAGHEPTAR